MMDKGRTTAWTLALAGLIPFAGCAVMVVAGGTAADAWLGALIAYAAVILSFLGGTRWGAALESGSPHPITLILSNLPALVGWAALLPLDMPSPMRLTLLSAGLALMWLWDRRRPPAWYPALRTAATVGAVVSLGLAVATG
jgi:hypothetical protein